MHQVAKHPMLEISGEAKLHPSVVLTGQNWADAVDERRSTQDLDLPFHIAGALFMSHETDQNNAV